ncbi:ribbon-helix-helix protein, CopG family [Mycobacterium sp. M1]|uniref:Ribbon-helix-helix protein, CopG family n=1 Tax=Mycolicibacter acidiphilus TaxID=2835306 RepID=A0ABS5RLP6_9MYCO|nr:ribbon-helix-helix protein, CopG family [Mycolicibacter acidiphilus]
MTKRRISDDDYTAMARDFERGDVRPVGEPSYGETVLRRGRPSGRAVRGSTPVRSFRLPGPLVEQLEQRARDEDVSTSEITRKALSEYLARP